MRSITKYTLLLTGVLALTMNSCKKEEEPEITPEESFDKSGMLANIGDNLILPSYIKLKASVDSMKIASDVFIASPTAITLAELQTRVLQAYTRYQYCSAYQIGPAENEYVRSSFNTFPCDTVEINSKIATANYTLTAASDLDVKGFPALDFLLFRMDGDNNIVLSRFTTGTFAANAKTYLSTLINELKSKTDAVYNGWISTGGNYIATFKSSTGNDVGSSIGMLVNELNYDFELLKNAKIGIPLGKKTLGVPQPTKAEALYSAQSIHLCMKNLETIENIYRGRNELNSDGLGLDDYLVHIEAQYGSGSLNDAIINKIAAAKTKLALITTPLSDAVMTSPAIVDAAYIELQQLVVLLKVDMPSALGVSITYVDNDGD
jgi:predicted lipoprotein